jgi:hypothetical protein
LSDEVDAVARIDPADLETALNQPGLDIHSSRLPRLTMVFLNTQNSLSHCCNRLTFARH